MVDPGASHSSEGEGVCCGDGMMLNYPLAAFKVPEKIIVFDLSEA